MTELPMRKTTLTLALATKYVVCSSQLFDFSTDEEQCVHQIQAGDLVAILHKTYGHTLDTEQNYHQIHDTLKGFYFQSAKETDFFCVKCAPQVFHKLTSLSREAALKTITNFNENVLHGSGIPSKLVFEVC